MSDTQPLSAITIHIPQCTGPLGMRGFGILDSDGIGVMVAETTDE